MSTEKPALRHGSVAAVQGWCVVHNTDAATCVAAGRGCQSQTAADPEADALDWIIRFAEAYDASVPRHYFHIADGQHETCGCKWEGNDDPR